MKMIIYMLCIFSYNYTYACMPYVNLDHLSNLIKEKTEISTKKNQYAQFEFKEEGHTALAQICSFLYKDPETPIKIIYNQETSIVYTVNLIEFISEILYENMPTKEILKYGYFPDIFCHLQSAKELHKVYIHKANELEKENNKFPNIWGKFKIKDDNLW